MTNNMIERIARTFRNLTIKNGGVCRGDDETGWRDYVEDARSIVEAMRFPTMEMVDAVHDSEDQGLHPRGSIEPRLVWSAMIDAALKEER